MHICLMTDGILNFERIDLRTNSHLNYYYCKQKKSNAILEKNLKNIYSQSIFSLRGNKQIFVKKQDIRFISCCFTETNISTLLLKG